MTSGGNGGATILSENANGGGTSFAQGTVANATSSAASASDATTATQAATHTDYNPDDGFIQSQEEKEDHRPGAQGQPGDGLAGAGTKTELGQNTAELNHHASIAKSESTQITNL